MDNTLDKLPNPKEPSGTPLLGNLEDGSYAFLCRWCGRYEVMTPEEVQWYAQRDYTLPGRCPRCRRRRREILAGRKKDSN